MPTAHDLHPPVPDHQYITELSWAYELHQSASATTLLRNRPLPEHSAIQTAQRQQLLDISIAILISARNKALDDFCAAWIKFRKDA